jgi:hypothetical protein
MSGNGIFVLTGHGRKQQNNLAKEKVKPFVVCRTLSFIIKDAKN